MCKMLFIGTKTELQEVPFDKEHPRFYVEKISGDFLLIKHAFQNPYIYFVGTSRGCSCDFGIKLNKRSADVLSEVYPIQKVFNKIRKVAGTYEQWEECHQKRINKLLDEQADYLSQTVRLIDLIEQKVQQEGPVELYCVWAGDYEAAPEIRNTIDFKRTDLREDFEIDERELIVFTG
ncbi:hypothetical protein V9K67_26905 [Paraflavisolibacter sp. H34]|uniref:hypothetical protein n=1 Tax=Huijunlia imazamoxiresistens TaxID=3127457 RepID=UPI003016A061